MAAIVRHESCGGGGGGTNAADRIDDDCDDASLLAFVLFVPFALALGGGPEGSGGAAAFESMFRIVPAGLLGPALGGGCGLGGGPGDFGDFAWVAGEAAAARAFELGGGPGGSGGNGDFSSDSLVALPGGGVRGGGMRGGGGALFPFSVEEMEEMEDRRTQSAAPENEESLGRPGGDACGEPGDAPPTLLAADGRCPFRSVSVSGGEPGGGGPMSDISGTPERLEKERPGGAEDGGPPTSEPRTDQSSETKRGGGRSAVGARPSPLSSASFLTSAAAAAGVSPAPPSRSAPREMETLREEDRVRDGGGGGGGGALASAPPTTPPMRSPRETEALREEERVRVAEERFRTRDLLFRREPVGLSIVDGNEWSTVRTVAVPKKPGPEKLVNEVRFWNHKLTLEPNIF